MAATKSTKTKTTKTTGKTKTAASKTAGAKKSKNTTKATKTSKAKVSKVKTTKAKVSKPKTTKAKTTRTSTKSKSTTAASKKNKSVVNKFLVDVVKQANKVEKKAQQETKVWIKKLNGQDKKLSQLTKKLSKAKGRSKTTLDKQINKLQTEMSVTRTGLLAAENGADKVATFIEWTTQLSAKPSITAFMQPGSHGSRPTLVSGGKSSKPKTVAPSAAPFEEEEYPEETDEEMNFLFGEDEDEEANR